MQEFLKRGKELRAQGARHHANGEFAAALRCFEQCGTLLPAGHPDAASVACDRATCHLRLGAPDKALKDANMAMRLAPTSARAAQLRARAHESKGHLHQALDDVVALRKAHPEMEEARVYEERLRKGVEAMNGAKAGKKHEAAARAMGMPLPGAKGKAVAQQQQERARPPPTLKIRCVLEDDVRMLEVPAQGTFEDVKKAIRAKFPGAGTLAIKYEAENGELVTVAGLADLRVAIQTAAMSAMREAAAAQAEAKRLAKENPDAPPPKMPQLGLPYVSLHLVRVVRGGAIAPVGDAIIAAEDGEECEFDDYIFDFADLFRQQLGIDPDGHVSIHSEGLERCQEALETVATSEEAQPLFDEAAGKFQEVAALAMFNWGNVHMCCARKRAEGGKAKAAKDKKGADGGADASAQDDPLAALSPEEALAMDAKLMEAEAKYAESLRIKADFYEALVAWGQQRFERAKLFQAQEGAAAAAIARPAPERGFSAGERAAVVDELYVSAIEKYTAALEMLPGVAERQAAAQKISAEKAAAAAVRAGTATPEAAAATASEPVQDLVKEVTPQVLVMWGNVLYEQSAILVRKGDKSDDWQDLLVDAVKKFKEAGCGVGDINGALSRHASKDAASVVAARGVTIEEEKKDDAAQDQKDSAAVTASPAVAAASG